jgi:hypothetical protein
VPPAPEEDIDPDTPTPDAEEAISALVDVITDPDALDTLTDAQIETLISDIDDATFTDEQAAELSAVLSSAPDEVKAEFEQQIDVFGGQFDIYVPIGSAVDVGTRRSLIAATTATTTLGAIAAPTSKRRAR